MTIPPPARTPDWGTRSATMPKMPASVRSSAETAQPAETAEDTIAISRQRFAGLFGLDPAQLYTGATTPAAAPRQTTAASDGVSPTKPAAVNGVWDRTDITVPVGTIVDGMVSAGTLSPGLAASFGPLPPPSGTRLLTVAPDAASFNYDPIALLRDRLSKMGYSDGGATFERTSSTNAVPGGGSTTYQYVKATWPNGHSERYAVERLLQNPEITATEINSLVASGFGAASA